MPRGAGAGLLELEFELALALVLALVGGGRVLSVLTRWDTCSDAEEIILREGSGSMFMLDMMGGRTSKSPVKICRSLVHPDTSLPALVQPDVYENMYQRTKCRYPPT